MEIFGLLVGSFIGTLLARYVDAKYEGKTKLWILLAVIVVGITMILLLGGK